MDYLAREGAPISSEMWEKIDAAVIDNAKKHMVCRRFLSLYGPLGAGASTVVVDSPSKEEELKDGVGRITGRRILELPQFYQDFALLWRDIEDSQKQGYPLDLSVAAAAAQRSAKQEDDLILFGSRELGTEGLLNAEGAFKIKRGDWSTGEDAYKDVAHGISYLSSNSMLGRYALVLSPEIYLELERLQPNVGSWSWIALQSWLTAEFMQQGLTGLARRRWCVQSSVYGFGCGTGSFRGISGAEGFQSLFPNYGNGGAADQTAQGNRFI